MILLILYFAVLIPAEAAVIAILVAPFSASSRTDWLISTLLIAPAMSVAFVWLLGLTMRLSSDATSLFRWVTGKQPGR